jgi:hypothetical protein
VGEREKIANTIIIYILWYGDQLLSSDSVNSGRCCITHATIEERCFLCGPVNTPLQHNRDCFLRGPCQGAILKTNGATVQLRVQVWSANQRATA